MTEIWYSKVMAIGIVFIGLCVGSFLNVAIHRIPRGLSVNDPKRSFCPFCESTLPAWQNIPVITWLIQRGKCRSCNAPIAVRYLLVEILTGALYFAAWWFFPMTSAILAMVLFTILVTITFIDAEHQVIPLSWTTAGAILALGGSFFSPMLLDLPNDSELGGVKASLTGWVVGFCSLYAVLLLGKVLFGKFKRTYEKAESWKLQEGHGESEQLHFVVGEEAHSWDDLFYRDQDELLVIGHGFRVDGKRQPAKELRIKKDTVRIGERTWEIDQLDSLEGKATQLIIPREAMGLGDPHLLAMIGAFLGWPAVVFVIFASSVLGMLAALCARIGFGRNLPFGPFLAGGAILWIFGAWELWNWYFDSLQSGFAAR